LSRERLTKAPFPSVIRFGEELHLVIQVTASNDGLPLYSVVPKYFVPRRMASSGLLRRVALVRTDVSDELSASFIRVTRIGELGTTLAVACHPYEGGVKFLRNVFSHKRHIA
jgi:hypothetical protein